MSKVIEIENIIEINQPIGTFYVAKMDSKELLEISHTDERYFNSKLDDYIGTQRELNKSKLNSLKEYIKTIDATFPNTIIGTLSGDSYSLISDNDGKLSKIRIELEDNDEENKPFQVIDGQHRLYSFKNENITGFDLLVTFFIDASESDQAYIFSVINTNQTKLNPSLLQDLSSLSKVTTPEKVVHSITKKFNKESVPLQQRIKMLGKKDETSNSGIISQYTFSKSIIEYIYNKKDAKKIRDILLKNNNDRAQLDDRLYDKNKYIFWQYYKTVNQKLIYNMLLAYYTALSETFTEEWGNPSYILCKTTGYTAFMKLFKDFYVLANEDTNTLSTVSFYKERLEQKIKCNINLLEADYRLGETGISNLYNKLRELFYQ